MSKAMKEIQIVYTKYGNAPMRVLDKSQEKFLDSYVPGDECCTTGEEMDLVDKALDLSELTIDNLRATRNAVVVFYHNRKQEECDAAERDQYPASCFVTKRYNDLTNAMMSVTAVIDHHIFMSGGRV